MIFKVNLLVNYHARGCRSGYIVVWSFILVGFSRFELPEALIIIINGINIEKNKCVKELNPKGHEISIVRKK